MQIKNYNGVLYEIKINFHPLTIKCTDEHPFYVRYKNKIIHNGKYEYVFDKPEWKKAYELNKNYYFGMKINENNIIPKFNNINLSNPDIWYILGYYMANSSITENHICFFIVDNKNTKTIIDRITKYLHITKTQKYEYTCQNLTWYNLLNQFHTLITIRIETSIVYICYLSSSNTFSCY